MKKLLFTLFLLSFAAPALFAQAGDTLWITPVNSKILAVKFSPDDKYLFAATPNGIEKYDAITGSFISKYNINSDGSNSLCTSAKFSSNSSKAIFYSDQYITLCDMDKEEFPWSSTINYLLQTTYTQFKEISSDGKYAYFNRVYTEEEKQLIIYNLEEKKVDNFLDVGGDAKAIAASPDGKRLAICNSLSEWMRIYNPLTLLRIMTIDDIKSNYNINLLSFSYDGNYLYYHSGTNALGYQGSIYNFTTETIKKIIDARSGGGGGDIFNRDNKYIVNSRNINEWDSVLKYNVSYPNVQIYSTFDGFLKKSYKRLAGTSLGVSHDDSKLAVGNDKQLVMLAPRFSEILSVESRDASANPKPYIFQLAGNKLSITPIADNLSGKAEIANIFGQTVFSRDLSQTLGTVNIDISDFTAGVYFIRIGNSVKKFVKM